MGAYIFASPFVLSSSMSLAASRNSLWRGVVNAEPTILEFKHITKQYPGVLALENVSLDFRRGEVHALCGENGAGKSTLIKTCTGAIQPTSGEIVLFGKSYSGFSPSTAKDHGIAVIYQEFNLVNEMTVAENIFLGDRPPGGIIFKPKECVEKARQVLRQLDLNLDPNTYVKDLTVGYQQLVEIAKAMSKDAKIIIMDEPSAPLTNQEVDILFKFVGKLKQAGVTVIYISHRLEEIFAIADRVSVLRDGKYIDTKYTADTNQDDLIRMMVGREIRDIFPPRDTQAASSDPVLELKSITGNGLKNVTLSLKRGEVLGLGGLIGAGRTELAQIVFGFAQPDSGQMFLNGKPYSPQHPKDAITAGIALVPEDRKRQGVLVKMSIRENMTMASIKSISRRSVINRTKERETVGKYKESLRIKMRDYEQLVNNLSGGNQQKIALAKWLAADTDIMILDEPTRGIDVGAKQEIYLLIRELTRQGKTLIVISSEMPELMGMSDRIVVLCEGEITGELMPNEFEQEKIMAYASGSTGEE